MKQCKVIFRDENLKQDIIINCTLDDNDVLDFQTTFDPPADAKTDLGALSGQLAHAFMCMLKGNA